MALAAFFDGPEVVVVLMLVSVAALGFEIWAIVDMATKPDWAWNAVGANKTLWIVLVVLGFVVCGLIGLVTAIVYFSSTRNRITQAMAAGPPLYASPYGGYRGVYPPMSPSQGPPSYPPQGWPQYPPQANTPPGGPPEPGWWQASDGNWYPPPHPWAPRDDA